MINRQTLLTFAAYTLLYTSMATAQTVWTGGTDGEWNSPDNWDRGLPGPENLARINSKQGIRIQVKNPVVVQSIEINSKAEILIDGESITIGVGKNENFNSILVNSGDVTINNKLINSQNKRIALNEEGNSLTLNGNIETGDNTTQIGNLGQGTLTLNGDRSGGNMLIIRDGTVITTGILSNQGGGGTQILDKGVLVSKRGNGPSIELGSFGLELKQTGIFRLAAPNQIAGHLLFSGGKLEMGGFSNNEPTVGNATLLADSVIDFSNAAAESLTFANVSQNPNWKPGATLQIVGFTKGDELRFGENASGLTEEQLAAIKFDGKPAQIDGDGHVTPAP